MVPRRFITDVQDTSDPGPLASPGWHSDCYRVAHDAERPSPRLAQRAAISHGAIAAVVSLAVAVGAGTTIVAVVDRTLLSPLPFPEPDALVVVGEVPADNPAASPRP